MACCVIPGLQKLIFEIFKSEPKGVFQYWNKKACVNLVPHSKPCSNLLSYKVNSFVPSSSQLIDTDTDISVALNQLTFEPQISSPDLAIPLPHCHTN